MNHKAERTARLVEEKLKSPAAWTASNPAYISPALKTIDLLGFEGQPVATTRSWGAPGGHRVFGMVAGGPSVMVLSAADP